MDPISAMIMAGGGLLGGLMNTSSQQAINAQQMQFATQQATGAFLPQQIANAQKAGINPLAVIGSGSGAGLQLSSPRPGDAITNSLSQIAKMQTRGQARQDALSEEATKAQIAYTKAQTAATLSEAQRVRTFGQGESRQGGIFSRAIRAGGVDEKDPSPVVKFGDEAFGLLGNAADRVNQFSHWLSGKLLGQ